MKRLTGLDNYFLSLENHRTHMHVASLGIYDPSTAPSGKVRFKQILDFFTERAASDSRFRRQLVRVPLELDRPSWKEAPEIDIEYHVRHIGLPQPGDWRQLMIQIARIQSRQLDLSRPAWEAYIIEGLNNIEGIPEGSFALYLKMHHASIDGQSSIDLLHSLHTSSPDSSSQKTNSSNLFTGGEKTPSKISLTANALVSKGKQMAAIPALVRDIGKTAYNLNKKNSDAAVKNTAPSDDNEKVQTRFDVDVSPHRVIDAFGISLDDCKTIRKHIANVTINDIFMSVVAGGINKYLSTHKELPKVSLSAMVPIAGKATSKVAGNNFAMTQLPMHTNIADPLLRIKAINVDAVKGKAMQADIGTDLTLRLMDAMPSGMLAKLSKFYISQSASMVISNVRGPENPLYLAGAKMKMFVPISIPFDKAALNVTGYSYNGVLWVCAISCRDVMPDPDFFTDCMRSSFKDLLATAIKQKPTEA